MCIRDVKDVDVIFHIPDTHSDFEAESFSQVKSWLLTHEVVVPGDLTGNHEEAQEAVREQHLHSLIVGWQVTFRVVALVCVLSTPLVAAGCQLVGCERARAWCEAENQKVKCF